MSRVHAGDEGPESQSRTLVGQPIAYIRPCPCLIIDTSSFFVSQSCSSRNPTMMSPQSSTQLEGPLESMSYLLSSPTIPTQSFQVGSSRYYI